MASKEFKDFMKNIIHNYKIIDIEEFIYVVFEYIKTLSNSVDLDEKALEFSRIIIAYSTVKEDEVLRKAREELKGLING